MPIPEDLAVGIPPEQQMRKHRLPQDERGHLRVGLVVQETVGRMGERLLTAPVRVLADMQRQAGHRFRNHPDTGVHRRGLQRGMLIDHFAGGRAAKQEGKRAAQTVLGLIAGVEAK